ncbi:hypothetical protein [Candidatus Phytoplasma sp. AldY-WA1]|uniref:hypothetical protein n=1 Tax=Candidatus Phytoplasma sp. AldY-WA1 TaxID=2852100 RepID=UPI002549C351|nr:hypothetical protein [Candidatus Phytoplasma sp. AldY-WA1]
MLFDIKKKFNFLIKLEYLLLKGNKYFSFKNKKITNDILLHIIAEMFTFKEKYYWNDFIKTKNHFHQVPENIIETKCETILSKAQENKIFQFAIKHEIYPIRVVGFIIQEKFFLICIDLEHKLYSEK